MSTEQSAERMSAEELTAQCLRFRADTLARDIKPEEKFHLIEEHLTAVFKQILDELDAVEADLSKEKSGSGQLIDERDHAQDKFDELVTLLGVETEYSNLRGFDEIIEDCSTKLSAIKAERDAAIAERDALRDEVAELKGIPQCAFCRKRSQLRCSNRACNAAICDEHGSVVGSFHVSMANPKYSFGGCHVECDRCHGITTSKLKIEAQLNETTE